MKHVVTLTTSNPAHEHVSLRRRQSTTNFMVEAADEQTAILRATAHFKRLGHYIHEAKIYKKKDQLNELASNSAFIDDSAAKAGLKRNPGESDANLVKRITAAKGIHDKGIEGVYPELALIGGAGMRAANVLKGVAGQAGSAIFDKIMKSSKDVETGLGNLGTAIVDKGTSAGKIVRDEILSHAVSLPLSIGIQAGANKASGKETNLGSIVKDDQFLKSYAETPGLAIGSRISRFTGDASKYMKDVADDVVASALQRARSLVPGKIDLPTLRPEIELEPAVAPQKVMPSVKPEVKTDIATKTEVKPETVVGKAEVAPTAKAEPSAKAEVQPKPKQEVPTKTKVETEPKPKKIRKLLTPSFGDGPDVDPGTLGQYRGLFPIYRFTDFNRMQESAPMNAIGRVLAKRKKNDKEDAEGETNKINMEPKLGGKA